MRKLSVIGQLSLIAASLYIYIYNNVLYDVGIKSPVRFVAISWSIISWTVENALKGGRRLTGRGEKGVARHRVYIVLHSQETLILIYGSVVVNRQICAHRVTKQHFGDMHVCKAVVLSEH